jgi:hypothetical protein
VTTPKTCTLPPPKPPAAVKPGVEVVELPPERSEPDLVGMGLRRAIDHARVHGFTVEASGAGDVVVEQSLREPGRISVRLDEPQ